MLKLLSGLQPHLRAQWEKTVFPRPLTGEEYWTHKLLPTLCFLPCGTLQMIPSEWLSQTECEQDPVTVFYNLLLEMASLHFRHILLVRSKSINPAHTWVGGAGEGAVELLKWVNAKEQGSRKPCQKPTSSARWHTSLPRANYIHPFPRSPKVSSHYTITLKARIWSYKSGSGVDEIPWVSFLSWVQSFSISRSVKIICLPCAHLHTMVWQA